MSLDLVRKILAVLLAILWLPPAVADYEDHPRAQVLKQRLAQQHGFSAADLVWVEEALDEADRIDRLVQQERKSPEKTRTWAEYRPIHINRWNIDNGVNFMSRYAAELQKAEDTWRVPKEIVAAIIGVETKYGGYTGKHRVLDALATQGFEHPTRSEFFFDELTEFFVLCKETGMRPEDALGSYAGAMGMPQFMPSNYRRLAVDFDDDGVVDLWEPVDAIGSAANYLANYRGAGKGWKLGQPVAEAAELTAVGGPLPPLNQSKWPEAVAAQLVAAGIRAPSLRVNQTPVGLLELQGKSGREYWVAYDNFFVIMSYNPRTMYAMSVFQLSEEIRARVAARAG